MERILNEDERLRRAEEIYLKRNNRNINLSRDKENSAKRYFGSKILLNLIVLFDIAVIVFCLQNKDYIFTKEFLNECNQYNLIISEKVNNVIKNFLVEDVDDEQTKESTTQIQNTIIKENLKENSNSGSVIEGTTKNVESSLSEMELDIQNLRKIYKFVKPLDAQISSGFGERESEYQNVSGYHKGIDLAAEKGTLIKAAMEGIVTLVSDEGDYRKAYKN